MPDIKITVTVTINGRQYRATEETYGHPHMVIEAAEIGVVRAVGRMAVKLQEHYGDQRKENGRPQN